MNLRITIGSYSISEEEAMKDVHYGTLLEGGMGQEFG